VVFFIFAILSGVSKSLAIDVSRWLPFVTVLLFVTIY
jgi:hypothetical protein